MPIAHPHTNPTPVAAGMSDSPHIAHVFGLLHLSEGGTDRGIVELPLQVAPNPLEE